MNICSLIITKRDGEITIIESNVNDRDTRKNEMANKTMQREKKFPTISIFFV